MTIVKLEQEDGIFHESIHEILPDNLKMSWISMKFEVTDNGNAPSHMLLCCAAIFCQENHSCHHPIIILSGSHSELLLAAPQSENGPQGDTFCNSGGHQIECNSQTPKIAKEAFC
jgi:hypothetical protein